MKYYRLLCHKTTVVSDVISYVAQSKVLRYKYVNIEF
jgi:hypothetical protein